MIEALILYDVWTSLNFDLHSRKFKKKTTTSQHSYLCMAHCNRGWSSSAEYSSQSPCGIDWCRFFHPIHRWNIRNICPFDRGGSSVCHSDTQLLSKCVCPHSTPQTYTDGPNFCHNAVLHCADFSLQNIKARIIYSVTSNLMYPYELKFSCYLKFNKITNKRSTGLIGHLSIIVHTQTCQRF